MVTKKELYIAQDGFQFDTELAALEHEAKDLLEDLGLSEQDARHVVSNLKVLDAISKIIGCRHRNLQKQGSEGAKTCRSRNQVIKELRR